MQELQSKRGDGRLFKMGLFSRGYGIHIINELCIQTLLFDLKELLITTDSVICIKSSPLVTRVTRAYKNCSYGVELDLRGAKTIHHASIIVPGHFPRFSIPIYLFIIIYSIHILSNVNCCGLGTVNT